MHLTYTLNKNGAKNSCVCGLTIKIWEQVRDEMQKTTLPWKHGTRTGYMGRKDKQCQNFTFNFLI